MMIGKSFMEPEFFTPGSPPKPSDSEAPKPSEKTGLAPGGGGGDVPTLSLLSEYP